MSKISEALNLSEYSNKDWDEKSPDWVEIGNYLDTSRKSIQSNLKKDGISDKLYKLMKSLQTISELIKEKKHKMEAPYLKKSFSYSEEEIVKLIEENVRKLDKVTDLLSSISRDLDTEIIEYIDNIQV